MILDREYREKESRKNLKKETLQSTNQEIMDRLDTIEQNIEAILEGIEIANIVITREIKKNSSIRNVIRNI
jgi:hypothetical protein